MAFRRKSSGARSGTARRSGTASGRGSQGTRLEIAKVIAGALAVFLLIRIFLLEAYRIPSGSMIPTLLVGDWLFVNKLAYGPHVPGTRLNLPGYDQPKRGDVVVFISPPQRDQPTDSVPPGQTVRGSAGRHDLHEARHAPCERHRAASGVRGLAKSHCGRIENRRWLSVQKPFELKTSRFGPPAAVPTLDNWGPLIVPTDHLFMLGDNRYDSKDGRYWGFVPRRNVRGRPWFVYYSYRADDSDRPLPFLTDIRWGRIGTRIK